MRNEDPSAVERFSVQEPANSSFVRSDTPTQHSSVFVLARSFRYAPEIWKIVVCAIISMYLLHVGIDIFATRINFWLNRLAPWPNATQR